jgi:Ulp1 family protease
LRAEEAAEVSAKRSWAGEATEVLCERFNIEMDRQHFRCLRRCEWLNDEVMNFYLGMLQERSDAEASAASAASGGETTRRVWFANTFFLTKLREDGYSYNNVRNWTRDRRWTSEGGYTIEKTFTKVLDMDLIIIPRHIGGVHWTCIVVDVPARTVTHHDSLGKEGGTAPADLARVVRWLCDEAREKCGTSMAAGDWETRDLGEGAPQQQNDW